MLTNLTYGERDDAQESRANASQSREPQFGVKVSQRSNSDATEVLAGYSGFASPLGARALEKLNEDPSSSPCHFIQTIILSIF